MEFYDGIENIKENSNEIKEKTELSNDVTGDFLKRLEQENVNAANDKSKAISFGSLNDVDYNLEKYNKAKEDYEYRVNVLEKSVSKGENINNEKLDVEYAKRAVEKAEIDLKYAKKYNS